MKSIQSIALSLLTLVLLTTIMATPSLAGDEIPVVTGKHWNESSMQQRRAFLFGVATIIELEQEVQGVNPDQSCCKTLIHSWVKGLSPYTLDEVYAKVDQWYADNPDKQDTAVLRVMWEEMVVPELEAK